MVWDPTWENVFCNQSWGKYPGEELIRFVARNFYHHQDRDQIKILEVGCGPGANLWFMAREGFSVYGIDGSQAAISQALERLGLECPGWLGQLHCGDIRNLPFADGMFDAVIDNEAVYCNDYDTSKAIYFEMARVTKAGGKFYSRTFASESWGDQTGKAVGHNAWVAADGPLANKGFSRFTKREELPDLIQGFNITEVELLMRTYNNEANQIREWLVIGEKQS
ncbi:MAG: class I SAM-dependent methyltransferase [Rhodocyclaceae bacterium]|nr:class I SAM-dependent methyltransferase [Rhodocyclaceae bacterium]